MRLGGRMVWALGARLAKHSGGQRGHSAVSLVEFPKVFRKF